MITINGEQFSEKSLHLKTYLQEHQMNPQRIAVEMNGRIVPKEEYDTCVLQDGDRVEIVHFVGGG